MRLIDADELIEHAWRDRLDSRELIAQMIETAPTVKEIPTKIPINVFERLISQEPETGRWKRIGYDLYECSICGQDVMTGDICAYRHCHCCGAKMFEPQESEDK